MKLINCEDHIKVLRPPETTSVVDWVENNVVLNDQHAVPGPLRIRERTPYLVEPLELLRDNGVNEITFMASTQVGKTTFATASLMYAIDQKPSPAMWVMPTETTVQRFIKRRLAPILENSKTIAPYVDKIKEKSIDLTHGMNLTFAWANSPSMLAMEQICWLIEDEVDKFPLGGGKEADALSLAEERTRTFWDSKTIRTSTPTTNDGLITREFERSDKRHYHVPCPHCGGTQKLEFKNIKWNEGATSDDMKSSADAWYQCEHCEGKIEDHHKPMMLKDGEWNPESRGHRGYRITALYSPWLKWWEIAKEFLESKSDKGKMQNFKNSWLAETWEDRVSEITVGTQSSVINHARNQVPDWARAVVAGIDWHGKTKGLYWSVWAIGAGMRAALIDYGIEFNRDNLWNELVERDYLNFHGGVDAGYEQAEVFKYCRGKWPKLRPTKGRETLNVSVVSDSYLNPKDRATKGMPLMIMNTEYFKDFISANLDGGSISLCCDVEDEFITHLTNETKINKGQKKVWVPKYSGAPNHWLDTTVIAFAVAERLGWSRLKDKKPESVERKPRLKRKKRGGWL